MCSQYKHRKLRLDLFPRMNSTGLLTVLLGLLLFFIQLGCTEDPVTPRTQAALNIAATDGGGVFWEPHQDSLPIGSIVCLSAQADDGYYFAGFEGTLNSVENPLAVTIRSDIQITAVFKPFPTGLIQFNTKDVTFQMGSDDPQAAEVERPAHPVKFTYDFALASTEVTQAHYAQVMGNEALDKLLARGDFGRGDSLPVYNITWYEAALFCNALSNSDGLDTVYSYDGTCEVIGACPYVLENLKINYERDGYRLPTEAEWEYALKRFSRSEQLGNPDAADDFAWHSLNADGPRNVGQLSPTEDGLFDMAGNVAEWVNDWLGAFPDSLVVNPAGPDHLPLEQFESSRQRPVRGGGWNLGESHLRVTNRVGPYETPATAASEAIGFRLAMGPFERKREENETTHPRGDSLDVTLLSKKSDLVEFLGTASCKLIFTLESLEGNRLVRVDFTDYRLDARSVPVEREVKRAVLSPNGGLIAYGTQYPGYSQGSRIGVVAFDDTAETPHVVHRENAFLPYWWTDTAGVDTFLIYTTGASENSDERWSHEQTIKHQFQNGVFGTHTVIRESGSYHGGLSSDGRFLATGYPRAYLWDRRLRERFPQFVPPHNGFSDSVQVCNVSINPGTRFPDRMMLLDFGSGQVENTVVGKRYGLHEFIFIVQSDLYTKHIVDYYRVPEDHGHWQDTRYTNHPDYGIGVGVTGSKTTVFLINLRTKEYLPLVSGENLRWPHLWIDPHILSEDIDPHHAFTQYNIPNTAAAGQTNITRKLKLFWKYRNRYEIAVVGSSPEAYGVNTSLFSSPSINLATNNGDQLTSNRLITNYILPHASQLEAVVIGLDPGFLSRDTRPEDPWLVGLYDSRGYNFDKDNNFWRDGIPQAVQTKIDAFTSSDWEGHDSSGFILAELGGTFGEPIIDQIGQAFEDSIVQMNLGFLRDAVDSCIQRNIRVLLVNAPQHTGYRDEEVMGRYGPRWEDFEKLDSLFGEWERELPLFRFYDAHAYGEHDYAYDEAVDPNHLNTKGAQKFSARIDSILVDQGL